MAQVNQEYSSSELESDIDQEMPISKKMALSPRTESISPGSSNGNNLMISKEKHNIENNKHGNSDGELSCNNNTSSDDADDGDMALIEIGNDQKAIDVVRKIKVSPSSSIEIAKVHVAAESSNLSSTSLVKSDTSHMNDNYIALRVENKLFQNVYKQELVIGNLKRPSLPNSLEWKDSGNSSCQESSQELTSPLEGAYLARSTSSISTRSFDSQIEFAASQASTNIQNDSDEETDSEGILTRVEEYTQERRVKMNADRSPSKRSVPLIDSQNTDPEPDVNDSNLGLCRFCMVNPKNGVFVHNNCLHLCCCYKCAIKVWKKRKSCPICNCKIKNVTKLFVH